MSPFADIREGEFVEARWREGQSRALMMAYINAPELDGSFTDDIAFDDHGLIAEYPKLFLRV